MSGQEIITQDGEIITETDIGSGSLAIGLAKAEIDQQVATAKRYPRSIARAQRAIFELVTIDEESAKECNYALPRGGKPITGPSIRLAEIIASEYGNNRTGARVVHVDRVEKFVEAEGVYIDLETNAATTARVRTRIVDRYGKLYSDDMIIVTGNAVCSKAKRNAILAGVPKAVWRKAYEAALATIKGDIKTLSERRDAMLKAFAAFGVKPEQIFKAIDIGGIDDVGIDEITLLTGMHAALKSGEETVESMFGGQTKAEGDKKSTSQKMSDFAKGDTGQEKKKEKPGSEETKKTAEKQTADKKNNQSKQEKPAEDEGNGEIDPPTTDDIEIARDKGHDAFHNGMPRETCPREFNNKGREQERDAWLEAFDAAEAEERNAQ